MPEDITERSGILANKSLQAMGQQRAIFGTTTTDQRQRIVEKGVADRYLQAMGEQWTIVGTATVGQVEPIATIHATGAPLTILDITPIFDLNRGDRYTIADSSTVVTFQGSLRLDLLKWFQESNLYDKRTPGTLDLVQDPNLHADFKAAWENEDYINVEADYFGLDLSEATEAVPEAIVQNWQLLAISGLSEQAYVSLLNLARKERGWRGEGSCPLDYRSLANFLHFWLRVSGEAVEPEFVLLPNGNLQAEWYRDDNHLAELEFQEENKCLFGLFDGESVLEGIDGVGALLALFEARNFRPLNWSYGD